MGDAGDIEMYRKIVPVMSRLAHSCSPLIHVMRFNTWVKILGRVTRVSWHRDGPRSRQLRMPHIGAVIAVRQGRSSAGWQ